MKRLGSIAWTTSIACLACLACSETGGSEEDAGSATADARPVEGDAALRDAGNTRVEVGTGFLMFELPAEGQVIDPVRGPQGGGRNLGYHIWGAVRMFEFDADAARVEFTILDAGTRAEHARSEVNTALMPSGGGRGRWGLAPRITDCCLIAGREIILRGRVYDADGFFGEDELTITAGLCRDEESSSICP